MEDDGKDATVFFVLNGIHDVHASVCSFHDADLDGALLRHLREPQANFFG